MTSTLRFLIVLSMLVVGVAVANAQYVETVSPPVTPPPTASSRTSVASSGASLMDKINKLQADYVTDAQVKKEVQQIIAEVTPNLAEDEGFLIAVTVYEHGETGQSLAQVVAMGKGKTEIDAATKFLAASQLLPQRPAGMSRNEKAFRLIWLRNEHGKTVQLEEPYPFSELTMQSAAAKAASLDGTNPSDSAAGMHALKDFSDNILQSQSSEVQVLSESLLRSAEVLTDQASKARTPPAVTRLTGNGSGNGDSMTASPLLNTRSVPAK